MQPFTPTFGICRECGFSHPPVIEGSCPMAPIKTATGKDITTKELEIFLSNFRVKLKIKIERTKIKNLDNFFIHINNELDNAFKTYKE